MRKALLIILSFIAFACGGHSEGDGHVNSVEDHSAHDHSSLDHSSHDHSSMESSPGAAEAPADLQFIDTMIVHHQGAVDMAKLAETQAERAELKKLAAAIIAEQEREITGMKRWRDEWFKDAKPAINMDYPGMREGMEPMDMKKLMSLRGRDFDREFLVQMIPHHEGALKMSEALLGKHGAQFATERDLLKRFVNGIIKSQAEEIEQMKKWLEEWK